ncbi:hypothetical protein PVAP13_5KG769601 [Panicum virgatum]|uniref:KIB1-4 beta-propeller domain-containing protein n=1 Tax=Panicum virgatum TaxID=38727 RepID=A0A8T0T585_PANVG|nr:hypothetical protein PVAP13_5KG769601 [Panicum virgatum]
MKSPQPHASELRDWGHLPDLLLGEVLQSLVPCLRSLSSFAATCPAARYGRRCAAKFLLHARSPLVFRGTVTSPLAAAASPTLLSSARGHLILLVRPRGLLVLVDALTCAERLSFPLPSPHAPHHYATLTPNHLVLFVSKHAFASLPFPPANPGAAAEWTHHRLPRAASFVASVVDFRGRVLGVTDRAQLLEFRCLDAPAPPADQEPAVQMLTATGLPEASTFESWHFGPRLVVAGERLLLLLLMTVPAQRGAMGQRAMVHKVSVHALHEMPDGTRRWEEVDNLGGYSVFVDCAGRSAIACADAAGRGDVAGNCIYLAELTSYGGESQRYWRSLKPWWNLEEVTISRAWPSQTWVYPRRFFQS